MSRVPHSKGTSGRSTPRRLLNVLVAFAMVATNLIAASVPALASGLAPTAVDDAYTVAEGGSLTTVPGPWHLPGWEARRSVTFNNLGRGQLDDFPVLVRLDPSDIDYSRTQGSGQDLRFVDSDGTPLDYEIEDWNAGGVSVVWVRVPQIDAGSTTDFIWMYYDNDAVGHAQNPGGVWSNGYVGVWHMNQDPSVSQILDSTSYLNHGTPFNMDASNLQAGQIGDGLIFDGSAMPNAEYIRIPSTATDELAISGSNLTLEAWVERTGATTDWMVVVGRQIGTGSGDSYMLVTKFDEPGRMHMSTGSDVLAEDLPASFPVDASFHYAAGVVQGDTMSIYTDGSPDGSIPSGVAPILTDANDVTIGAAENDEFSDPDEPWQGRIDEVRISDLSRSADWVNAQHASMTDTFITYGSDEQPGVLANDTDPETDPLTASLVSGPSHAASFSLNADGSFTYTPTAGMSGTDYFTYLANDGTSDSNVAMVTITVTPTGPNNPPAAVDDPSAGTVQDVPVLVDVLGNDTDPDPDSLTVSAITQGSNGTVVNNGTDVTYTPDPGWTGVDTFTYEASDGNNGFDTATVTVTVSPSANTAPVLDPAKSPALDPIAQDSPAPSGAVGTEVSGLVDFAVPAGQVDNVTDPDTGAQLGIAVTGANSTNGTWWYSINDGSSWSLLGSPTDAAARLLSAGAGNRLYFQPDPGYSGTISDAITFRAWDRTTGTNGGTADTSDAATFTVADNFDSGTYSGDTGTQSWTGDWQEVGESDGPSTGALRVGNAFAGTWGGTGTSGDTMEIDLGGVTGPGTALTREADLSAATGATLTYDYGIVHTNNSEVILAIDSGGGWQTLKTYSITADQMAALPESIPINDHLSASTRIKFEKISGGIITAFYVDNLQISADTSLNGGTTAFSDATDTASIGVTAPVPDGLWMSTVNDVVSPSGAPGLDSWSGGSALVFGDPGLAFEPPATAGTFSLIADFDAQAQDGNVELVGIDLVETATTVGTSPAVNLQPGDLLLSTVASEIFVNADTSTTVTTKEDVILFRPQTPGDFTSGTFTVLLDAVIGSLADISLVEQAVTVGDTLLPAGSLILSEGKLIYHLVPTGTGEGNPSGTPTLLVDGADVGVDEAIVGLHLVDDAVQVDGVDLTVGDLLVSLIKEDPVVGNNGISVLRQDVFVLELTRTTAGPTGLAAGDATLFFDGSDVGLNLDTESVEGVVLVGGTLITAPMPNDDTIIVRRNYSSPVAPLVNDVDPNGDPLSVQSFTQPANGTVTDNGDGTLTYTPDFDYTGSDSFTYTASDGTETAVATVFVDVRTPELRIVTRDPVVGSGTAGLTSWSTGELLSVGDPGFALEPPSTSGTVGSTIDFDRFASDGVAKLGAVHEVAVAHTLGSGPTSFDLEPRDLLLVSDAGETFYGNTTSIVVSDSDVFVFRPDRPGDPATSGEFYFLLENPASAASVRSMSLVEYDTIVGDTWFTAGTFLFTSSSDTKRIMRYTVDGTGLGTTSGTLTLIIDFADVGMSGTIGGVDLVERTVTAGGRTLDEGEFLLTMEGETTVAGLPVTRWDIFAADVTATTLVAGTTAATTTLVFDGSEAMFEDNTEDLFALDLFAAPDGAAGNTPPVAVDDTALTTTAKPVVIDVVANDTDADLDSLTVEAVTQGADGAVTNNGDGTVTYTSSPAFTGVDSFAYRVADGNSGTDTAFVTVTVGPAFVVNSTGDASDNNLGDGVCLTGANNTAGDPACTLRAAIEQANVLADADDINFAIPTSEPGHAGGIWTITPTAPYDDIVETVLIDATTQPGFIGDPIVALDGSDPGADLATAALTLESNNSLIEGFIVHSWDDEGLEIDASTGKGDFNTLRNNWVGIDASESVTFIGDAGILITVGANDNTIENNVIGGATNAGLHIRNAGSDNNIVIGNSIGVAPDGVTQIPNGLHGILIEDQASNNTIGGTAVGERNLISANTQYGILITGSGTDGNQVIGNYIGTDAAGTADLGNGSDGIAIRNGAQSNIIGGLTADHRNIISGNDNDGIWITDAGTRLNTVQGNWIGVASDGSPLGNSYHGVAVEFEAADNLVGGTVAEAANRIENNLWDGVAINGGSGTGNAVIGNSITGNVGLGIDIDNDGVTPNDPTDADTGDNDLLNFPVITSATETGGTITVDFDLDTHAGSYRLEFFANPSGGDPSGNGEGETLVGTVDVTVTGGVPSPSSTTFAGSAGDIITATTTEGTATPFGSTSEFSAAVTVIPFNGSPVFDQDLGNQTDPEASWISLSSSATDPEGDTLTYSATGLPLGLSINSSTGLITGMVNFNAAAGSPYSVEISVADGTNPPVTDTFFWTITNVQATIPFVVAGTGGGNGGDDLLTKVEETSFDPITNEVDIGIGTGTFSIEAIATDPTNGTLFAVDGGQFGSLNPDTGVFTSIGTGLGTADGPFGSITLDDVRGLTFHPLNDRMYGVHRRAGGEDILFRIDPVTGTFIPNAFGADDYRRIKALGSLDDVTDIAVDPTDWEMYGVMTDGVTSELVTIKRNSGNTKSVGTLAADLIGLDVTNAGQLWGTDAGALYTVDKTSGALDAGRPLDNGSGYGALAFGVNPAYPPSLEGVVFEDLDGNALGVAEAPDDLTNPGVAGVTVHLYRDLGVAGVPEGPGIDTWYASTTTGPTGRYFFSEIPVAPFWIVVDSSTIAPVAGGTGWAEQTYAPPGAVVDAAFTLDPVAGPLFGGMRPTVSDDFSGTGLTGAEHLAYHSFLPAEVVEGIDFGFSFNVVTNLEGTGAVSEQGSLRQFIDNANLGTGPNAMRFVPAVPTNETGGSGDWWSLALTNALPASTGAATTIDGTAFDAADGTTVVNPNAGGPELELNGTGVVSIGLDITGGTSTVRDLVINRFATGVRLSGGDANTVAGNYIGPDAGGLVGEVGNSTEGVLIELSENNTIGGVAAADRNVISGNRLRGIAIDDSSDGIPVRAGGNQIIGNYIGTSANGLVALPYDNTPDYQQIGLYLLQSVDAVIGTAADGNVISGNAWYGIYLWGPNSGNNTIQGNIVGLDFLAAGAVPNAFDTPPRAGIFISNAPGNLVGGTGVGEGNTVAGNADAGIVVSAAGATGNAILGNAISNNTSLGIDLEGDGVTGNDPGDSDSGANDLLNFPVITSATAAGGTVFLDVDVDLPAGSYRLEFFDNTAADLSGFGEGETLAGFYDLVGHPGGPASFSTAFAGAAGDIIAATATEGVVAPFGSTSEFSAAVTVVQAVFVVNSTGDDSDATPGDGICHTGNLNVDLDPECTLRAAIEESNVLGDTDIIEFAIPTGDPGHLAAPLSYTIQPATLPLPIISQPVTLDATTQPDFGGTPIIVVDGSLLGLEDGISLSASNSEIRGLVVQNFGDDGIQVDGNSNTIAGNYVGVDVTGLAAAGNDDGILVRGNLNTIGGTSVADRNVAGGNADEGVSIDTGNDNVVVGNYIGVDKDGANPIPNAGNGVAVQFGSVGNTIGGFQRNLISGNGLAGIEVASAGTDNTTIINNWIGTNAAGDASIPNGTHGVHITDAAINTVVGGNGAFEGNLISGNTGSGIAIDLLATDNTILNNFIGTNATGAAALPNGADGVFVDADNVTIGGTGSSDGNLVSGNGFDGLRLERLNATVQGNLIGTDITGAAPLPNGDDGIDTGSGTGGTTIGGTAAGAGNTIAFNGGEGIAFRNFVGMAGVVLANSIHSNTGLGIDLATDGVTLNDLDDLDDGPNGLLNFPVITLAIETAGTVDVDFDLDAPAGNYRIEFFVNTAADLSGYGEGETLVSFYDILPHPGGLVSYNTSYAGSAGQLLTATATNTTQGATSEFSAVYTVILANSAPTDITLAPSDVDENIVVGTTVGTLTTTDPDVGDSHTYVLVAGAGDTHNGLFTIVGDEVRTNAALDFETLSSPLSIRVETTDSGIPNLSYQKVLSIVLNDLNEAPVLGAIGNQTVDEQTLLTFTATATDEDLPGDTLTFSLSGEPAGAAIDPNTGVFTWTPTEAQGPGVYTFDVVVTDDGTPALGDSETISVTVNEVNLAPVLGAIGNQTVDELTLLTFTASATDADDPANTLTFSLAGEPVGAAIDPVTGVFTWTPTEAQGPGVYVFDVIVTDSGAPALNDSETISVTVNEANVAPVLGAVGNQTIDELALLTFTATATDADQPADALTFSLTGEPAGASIDPNTGVFTWTPTEAQGPGLYTFNVVVTDDGAPNLFDFETISVTVNEVNEAPVLGAIGNQTVDELTLLTFTATATDADLPANALTYTLSGEPAGAAIHPVTGVFTWTPTEAQGPGVYTFDVVVTDSGTPALGDSETISVTVNEVNVAPVVTNPGDQTNAEGDPVSLFVAATDADLPANTLTWSAAGLPPGLATNPVTGEISGTVDALAAAGSPYAVTVTVTDDGASSLQDQVSFSWTITDTNRPPALDPVGNQTTDELTLLTFTATASDPDADGLTFSLSGEPAGATIDPNTGVFTWTPTEAQGPGVYTFDVVVTDDGSPVLNDFETISVTVNEVNEAPVLGAIGNQIVDEGTLLTFTATASDADDPANTITFSLSGEPAGASIDPNTGVFTWTPTEAQGPGLYTFDVVVTDDGAPNLLDFETISVTVNEVNVAPVLGAIGNQTVDELSLVTFTASATDADLPANTLTYVLVGAPAGASIDPNTGVFMWTPTEAQGPGVYTFDVVVTDSGAPALNDSDTISVTVNEANVAPVLGAIGNQIVDEGTLLTFAATATDADLPANALTYTLSGAPAGAAIDPVSGVFTWTPTEAQGPGLYTFDVVVTDDGAPSLFDVETISVTVNEVNLAPVLDPIGNQTVDELSLVTFTASATDADLPANTLTYVLVGAPAGASIDPNTGVFTWTPTEAQGPGVYTFDVVVTDDGAPSLFDVETISVTVNEVNVAPVLDPIGNQTTDEQTLLTFTATASDADLPANALTYTLSGAPAGAAIHPVTGVFTWTPTEAQGPGIYTFDVIVTDSGTPALSDSETISVTVNDANVAPVLGPVGNQTVDEGTSLTFIATATDADTPANTLTFSLSGAPAGAAIDPVSGVFTWTPSEAQGPGVYTFDIIVTDDGTPNLNDFETISVTVNEVNLAPMLEAIGNQTVDEQSPLTFTATATDADVPANTLTFSLIGAPAGATIDPVTGVFTWTPTEAQGPGSYLIGVVVDDGAGGNDFETITVTVNQINQAPVVANPGDQFHGEGDTVSLTMVATDPDIPADPLTWSATGLPPALTIDPATGIVSGVVDALAASGSPYSITVTVTDDGGLFDQVTFSWTITDTNRSPVLDPIGNQSGGELGPVSFVAIATDPDGDDLSYTLAGAVPAGAAIDPITGVFTWTPTETQGPGAYTFDVVVTDDGSPVLSVTETITISVLEVNTAPLLTGIADQLNEEGDPVSLLPAAVDSDVPANALTWSATGLPTGITIDPTTGSISGTVAAGSAGSYPVVIVVTDDGVPALSDQITFTWNINGDPVANDDTYTVGLGETLSVSAPGILSNDTDAPGDVLTVSLLTAPSRGTLSISSNGSFTYEHTAGDATNDSFVYRVSDQLGGSATATVTIVVDLVNEAPVAVDDVVRGDEDQTISIDPVANDSDPDGDALTLEGIVEPTVGLATVQAGLVVFVPPTDWFGSAAIQYRISDGRGGSATGEITFEVLPVNDSPRANDDTVTVGSYLTQTIAILDNDVDADGDALTVALLTEPEHVSVSVLAGGLLAVEADIGWAGTETIVYRITDPFGLMSEATVIITVEPTVAETARQIARQLGSGSVAVDTKPATFDTGYLAATLDSFTLMSAAFFQTAEALSLPVTLLLATFAVLFMLGFSPSGGALLAGARRRFWAVVLLHRESTLPVYAEVGRPKTIYSFEPTARGIVSLSPPQKIDGKRWIQIDTPAGEGWIDADQVVRQIDLAAFMDDGRPPAMVTEFAERLRTGGDIRDLISDRGLMVVLGGAAKMITHDELRELLHQKEPSLLTQRWSDMDFRSHFQTAVVEPFLATYESSDQIDPKTPHSQRALIPTECWNFAYLALRGDGREPPWLVWFEYVRGRPRIVGLGVDV